MAIGIAERMSGQTFKTSGGFLLAGLLFVSAWGGTSGCAPGGDVTLRTDAAALQRLSDAERVSATAKPEAELTRARQELESATQELETGKRDAAAAPAEQSASEDALAKARAALAAAPADKQEDARHELEIAEAGVAVQASRQPWVSARDSWLTQVVEVARRHVAAADAGVELARAQLLARHDGSIEVERYRGQYARLHKAWSDAQGQLRPARQLLDHMEASLTSAKKRYAELKGTVLPAPAPIVLPPGAAQ